jgi:GxxExxY protein
MAERVAHLSFHDGLHREAEAEDEDDDSFEDFSGVAMDACLEVHKHLGPGLLEFAYEECLAHELALRGVRFERQRRVALAYKGMRLDSGYRVCLVVEGSLAIEIKAVEQVLPVDQEQLLTYMRLMRLPTGLLVNFHAAVLRNGIRRLGRFRGM